MSKQPTHTAVVISTLILGKKNYISGYNLRADGKHVPTYHTDPAKAKEFDSEAAARKYLEKVHNPLDRLLEVHREKIPGAKEVVPAKRVDALT